ncbi:ATP-binding protein [Venenivibrio stagnispumantis]|uniref:histidine kinase n=1 Tax=Venenivibrio stagnispumantis TaxID=407998 RepID=A0AA46AEF0_9AQUI|nr:ATP-binding protein [Venenivibrio stagnispumantis]MCW4572872.1 ATP-binding protein [Venenivibrio stagnispumantis]SMP13011.1 two-component system, NtrC family, nitrogen regulation sensor histidine kinase NtrY [Venenivibrio stagnispumantis]
MQKEKLKRNIIILGVVSILFIISNIYIFKKLEKIKDVINPYLFLFVINLDVIFFLILVALTLKYLIKIFFEEKTQGRLRTKLTSILIFMIVIPSMVLFTVSVSLISNATNLWFSGKIEEGLKQIEEISNINQKWIENVYNLIKDKKLSYQEAIKYFNIQAIVIYDKNGKILEKYGKIDKNLEKYEKLEKNRKIVIYYNTQISKEKINQAKEIYAQFKYYKAPIRISYISLLLTITMVVIFAAFWFGRYIVRSITIPIEKLAEASKRLSYGDLLVRVNVKASDEIGILIDEFNQMVSQLAQLYNKLEENKKYLETILENIRTGVIYTDENGNINNLNKAVEEILSVEKRNLIGKPLEQFLGFLKIEKIPSKETTFEYEGKLLIIKATKIKDKVYVIVLDDITDIITAQKLNTWKEIVRRIAHEIKNPLTPIKLSAERILIQYKKNNPNISEIIEKNINVIINEVEHLENLLREFSQFGTFLENLSVSNVNLKELLEILKTGYQTDKFKININIDKDIIIKADEKMLKQAFSNLIQNSIESGADKIDINVEDKDDYVIISFKDNGKGIKKENIEKIFMPYYSDKPKGSGLGLAITKEIIERHRGTINAVYIPNGALFIVKLPK